MTPGADISRSAQALIQRLLPVMVVGTERGSPDLADLFGGVLAGDARAASLGALALTGQALRFDRPAAPASYAADPEPAPRTRTIIPEALRARLVRSFGDGDGRIPPHDPLADGVAEAFERLRLQPHPFDFPAMNGFVATQVERLGPAAWDWVDRDRRPQDRRRFADPVVLDDGNWAQAVPSRRQRYLRDRRRRDPAGGRALVEAVWATAGADLRTKLLEAFVIGLSPADQPFLDRATGDRVARVREDAARLLVRLKEATDPTPTEAVLLRVICSGGEAEPLVLALDLPATVEGDAWRGWIQTAFAGVDLPGLADALGRSPAEVIAAAAENPPLATACAILAFRSGDPVLGRLSLPGALEACSDQWRESLLVPMLLEALDASGDAARRDLGEVLLRTLLRFDELRPVTFTAIRRLLRGPLSAPLMAELLNSALWQTWSDNAPSGFAVLAVLCPSDQRPALRAGLSGFSGLAAPVMLRVLDILDELEQGTPP